MLNIAVCAFLLLISPPRVQAYRYTTAVKTLKNSERRTGRLTIDKENNDTTHAIANGMQCAKPATYPYHIIISFFFRYK